MYRFGEGGGGVKVVLFGKKFLDLCMCIMVIVLFIFINLVDCMSVCVVWYVEVYLIFYKIN